MTADNTTVPTATEMSLWVRQTVARYVEMPAEDLDDDVKLVEYGLDSMYALVFCGDVEDAYELEIEPTTAWDHPTIAALTAYLVERLSELSR